MSFEFYRTAAFASSPGSGDMGFDFTTLGSCVGWWQVHNNDFLTFNGSDVSQITDRSGAGNHLVQATAANQAPVGNLINGVQALDFDGANYKYNASALLTPAAGTIAWVALIDSLATSQLFLGSGATAASNNGFCALNLTNGRLRARISDGVTQIQPGADVITAGVGFVGLMAWDSGNILARVNNNADDTLTHALGSLGTDDFWYGTTDNVTTSILAGALGNCVFYDELLVDTVRDTLVQELAEIYGISL